MKRLLLTTIAIGMIASTLLAQATNRGAGNDAHWLSAAKDGFGSSNTLQSKVWFTLTNGVLSEVYYPRLDVPNVQSLQLMIVTPAGVEMEMEDTTHSIQVLDDARSLSFR